MLLFFSRFLRLNDVALPACFTEKAVGDQRYSETLGVDSDIFLRLQLALSTATVPPIASSAIPDLPAALAQEASDEQAPVETSGIERDNFLR